jgi:hypothetical protein
VTTASKQNKEKKKTTAHPRGDGGSFATMEDHEFFSAKVY